MKNLKTGLIFFSFLGLFSCRSTNEENKKNEKPALTSTIQVQGHRGDRGNYPENTIPAFLSAVKKGVEVIELDIVISEDRKVVVSHEPFMSSLYMSSPAGDPIDKDMERSYNLYHMSYDSIRKYDSGSRGNRLFPNQKMMKTYKPLLSEVIDTIEQFISSENLQPVKYNIELKSVEAEYGKYQPFPEAYVSLVMDLLKEKRMESKVMIQSFDPNILNTMYENYPEIELAFLVSNEGIGKNLLKLNFNPGIYSPHYKLLKNEQIVDSLRSMGMQVIPWTVNDTTDIRRMIDLEVDAIITDYPERVLEMRP